LLRFVKRGRNKTKRDETNEEQRTLACYLFTCYLFSHLQSPAIYISSSDYPKRKDRKSSRSRTGRVAFVIQKLLLVALPGALLHFPPIFTDTILSTDHLTRAPSTTLRKTFCRRPPSFFLETLSRILAVPFVPLAGFFSNSYSHLHSLASLPTSIEAGWSFSSDYPRPLSASSLSQRKRVAPFLFRSGIKGVFPLECLQPFPSFAQPSPSPLLGQAGFRTRHL